MAVSKQLIGDGKDMKKELIFRFKESESGRTFEFFEGDNSVIQIPNDNLVLNSKQIYDSLFKDVKTSEKICIKLVNELSEKELNKDIFKRGRIIFDVIQGLVSDIETEINNLIENNIEEKDVVDNNIE